MIKKHPRHLKKLNQKAERMAEKLGRFMGVKAIFLSGSIAQGRATKKSDIDFFFIAQKNQIWTARFFVFLYLKWKKEIATPTHHAEKICPNHFISEDNLEIQEKDAYAAHLFSHNIPLYDPDNIFPQFAQTNQQWIQCFGQSFPKTVLQKKPKPIQYSQNRQKLILFLEWILKTIQKIKIHINPDYYKSNSKIILSETELRFHPEPKNKEFQS